MIKMDLGDRLIKLANKLLSAGSSETLGTQGGITNATANDVLVPTSKAVKDYVDGRTQPATTSSSGVVQLSDDIDSSSSTVSATSAAIKQLHDLIDDNASAIDDKYNELNTSKVDKVTGKRLSSNDFTNTYKQGLEFLMNAIVSEEVWFTTEPVPQSQFMVGTYSNQRLGSAILENKFLFQRFVIAAGGSILLYVWDADREEVVLPASLKDIVGNKQSQISYSNPNLILELINNNTELRIRNTGTTSIADGSISYNEE